MHDYVTSEKNICRVTESNHGPLSEVKSNFYKANALPSALAGPAQWAEFEKIVKFLIFNENYNKI